MIVILMANPRWKKSVESITYLSLLENLAEDVPAWSSLKIDIDVRRVLPSVCLEPTGFDTLQTTP